MPPTLPAPLKWNDTSTSSVWELPPSSPPIPLVSNSGLEAEEEDVIIPDQHRLRHLSSIQIRNLTLDPRIYSRADLPRSASSSTLPPDLEAGATSDDTDLYLSSKLSTSTARKGNRARGLSGASARSIGMGNMREGEDVGSSGALGNGETVMRSGSRGSMRSEFSTQGTIKESTYRRHRILDEREEGGEIDKVKADKGKGREILDDSTVVQGRRFGIADGTPLSGSRSGLGEAPLEGRTRRRQILSRKGLLDSYISISIPKHQPEAKLSSRQRTDSLAHQGGSSSRGKLSRSESFSSVSSRRKRATSTSTNQPPSPGWTTPVFISSPVSQSIHPTFEIDPGSFLVKAPVEDWTGFRESNLLVGVWVKPGGEGQGDNIGWELLIEWDIQMSALISIGRDSFHFPALPSNSLILKLNSEYYTCSLPSQNRHSSDSCSSDSEVDGNQSDPGVVSAAMIKRREKKEELEKEKRRRKKRDLVERSRRETRMVQGAGWEEVACLLTMEEEVKAVKDELAALYRKVDAIYGDPDDLDSLLRERVEIKDRVDDFEEVHTGMLLGLQDDQEDLKTRRETLRARRGRLKEVIAIERQRNEGSAIAEIALLDEEIVWQKVTRSARSRRTQLITLLSHIFPIEAVIDSNTPLLFSILSTPLPNSSYPPTVSDDDLSSALGYAAQVVSTLAGYLGVPLHYPIQVMGSRSAVLDLISVMRGPRAFPLYGRGVERYRFDYGVFLLNKNIEQLMYSQGLTVFDLRNTLPNLKALTLSLSYDPSHYDFLSSTLTSPPAFAPASSNPQDTSNDPLLAIPNALEPGNLPYVVEEYEEDYAPRSPSTVKALSVRSLSPVPTLKGSIRSNRSNSSASERFADGNGRIEKVHLVAEDALVDQTAGTSGSTLSSDALGLLGKMGGTMSAWRVGKLI